jgi:hypothetical protein
VRRHQGDAAADHAGRPARPLPGRVQFPLRDPNGTSVRAAVTGMSCGIGGKQVSFESSNSAVSP